jgi:hypothetical protein
MDIRSFKNADIDRKNEEHLFADDEPTMDCARCGRRGLGEEQVCIREWEGDSDAPMCAPCWDETEEEENALEEGGEEGLEILLNERKNLFGCSSTADMVSAELVEDPAEEIKAKIKHLLADLETAEGRGGVQRFITEELRYLF